MRENGRTNLTEISKDEFKTLVTKGPLVRMATVIGKTSADFVNQKLETMSLGNVYIGKAKKSMVTAKVRTDKLTFSDESVFEIEHMIFEKMHKDKGTILVCRENRIDDYDWYVFMFVPDEVPEEKEENDD